MLGNVLKLYAGKFFGNCMLGKFFGNYMLVNSGECQQLLRGIIMAMAQYYGTILRFQGNGTWSTS